MSGDLPNSAIGLLHALSEGVEFGFTHDDSMAVKLPTGTFVRVTDSDLAALAERALIRIADGEDGQPKSIGLTLVGRDWLRRWRAIHGRPDLILIPPEG